MVLATSSKYRQSIFKDHFPDLYFGDDAKQFLCPDVDEKAIRHPNPEDMVRKIAEAKCDQILKEHGDRLLNSRVVVTCDEIVVCNGNVREKPKDLQEATQFLKSYQSGDEAVCLNGLVVHHIQSGRRQALVHESRIRFKSFSDEVLQELLKDPIFLKCAGGFCVQNMGVHLDEIKGSVFDAEGLPVECLRDMMKQAEPELGPKLRPLSFSSGIKAVLFDMDGLLLDTERFYTIAQQKILDRFGIQFTMEVKSMMMGRKALDAAEIMIKHYGLEDQLLAEDFVREREEILDALFPDSQLLMGVERLLRHLHGHGVPLAIATSSHKRHFLMKSQKHKELFDQVFKVVVTGDMVKESKPHPEIFQEAFARLHLDDVSPSEVLVFEDAPLGVEAALAAGMKVTMVNEAPPKKEVQPTLYLGRMLYFLPEYWGLPKFV